MKSLKVLSFLAILFITMALSVYAKPGKGNGKGHDKHNPKIKTEKIHTRPHKRLKQEKKLGRLKKHGILNQQEMQDCLNKNIPEKNYEARPRRLNEKDKDLILSDLITSLNKLNKTRWSYNPNDTRGQGNMGKPEMLDPFGHDKDSDRMELYGNRGRVIKAEEPAPEPPLPPEPPPEEPPEEPPTPPEPEPPPEPPI